MKIKFLGTAAFEGVPSLFCNCPTCRRAREAGGKNLRSRLQALVNEDLLIDFPPDTVWHSIRFGLDWQKINNCLITHSHSDHLYPEDVVQAEPGYSREHPPLHFYSGKDGYEKLNQYISAPSMQGRTTVELIEGGRRFRAGEYSVLAVPANHDPSSSPLFFSVARDGKRLLYAHDTGLFSEEAWALLQEEKHFDLVSLDCTGGLGDGKNYRNNHMCLETVSETIGLLREKGLIDGATKIVINHFTHNAPNSTYDEILPEAEKAGVIVSYDGLDLEF